MLSLFPASEPYRTFRIKVSNLHELYVEEVGNPQGKPVVFLHGGPGAGCNPNQRRFFDPAHYRIILFDQRGTGRSTPFASLDENTTWDLVDDIEKIRNHLNIARWMVFGGSWGSTLALAYSEKFPNSCTQLILRGIFLCRKSEIKWFYQEGASWIYPDRWADYLRPIPSEERGDLVKAYYKRLTSSNSEVQLDAARAWSIWEGETSHLVPNPSTLQTFSEEKMALSIARIECHYFVNDAFLEENQLLNNVTRIRHIPTILIQGRYDIPCPIKSCWELSKAFPEAMMEILPQSGHSAVEPEIQDALLRATERFK